MTDSLGIAISGTMCMWRRDRKILRSRCQVLVCNMQLCSTPPSPVYLLVPWSLRVYSAVEPHTSATWCTETCTGCFSNRFLDGTTCISAASQVWQWGVLSWKVDLTKECLNLKIWRASDSVFRGQAPKVQSEFGGWTGEVYIYLFVEVFQRPELRPGKVPFII